MNNFIEKRKAVRALILKTLYCIDYTGEWPDALARKGKSSGGPVPYSPPHGQSGLSIADYLKKSLTDMALKDEEIAADLAYLTKQRLLRRRPEKMHLNTGLDQSESENYQYMSRSWYWIDSAGINVVERDEGKDEWRELHRMMRRIDQVNISHSAVAINSPNASITYTVQHPRTDDIEERLSQIVQELGDLPKEKQETAQRLVRMLREELALPTEQQDKGQQESVIQRLKKLIEGASWGVDKIQGMVSKLQALWESIGSHPT